LHLTFAGIRITYILGADFVGVNLTNRNELYGEETSHIFTTPPLPIAGIIVAEEFAISILEAGNGKQCIGYAEPLFTVTVQPISAQRAISIQGRMLTPVLRIAMVCRARIGIVAIVLCQWLSGTTSRLAPVIN